MKKKLLLLVWLAGSFGGAAALAQAKSASTKDDIEYESIMDDPYDLNKMWLHLYPMYGDAFMTNVNAGFGIQAQYLWKDKFDFRLTGRRSYYRGTDLSYGIGDKVKDVSNKLVPLTYVEGGLTYHIVDRADAGQAKIIIYTKRYSEGKWAATVPEFIMVPAKVRKIIGVRAGGLYWESATNLGEALKKQNVDLKSPDGTVLDRRIADGTETRDRQIYSNVSSTAFYLGGSMGRIRNVVVKPKKYDIAVHDVILTAYADVIYSPNVSIQAVKEKDAATGVTTLYATDEVKKSPLGFRAGFEGMYNREFSWSYGAEVGMRPSIQGRTLFFSVKIGFAFASRLDQRRQSYQKEK